MYFEEYQVGKVYQLEPLEFKAEAIIAFAEEFDKRPFHLAYQEGEHSLFQGLAASGLHTLVSCWNQWTKTEIDKEGMICGLEIEWNKWLKPVYAGDVLDIKVEIRDKVATSSDSRGVVKFQLFAYNQDGILVMDSAINTLVMKKGDLCVHC